MVPQGFFPPSPWLLILLAVTLIGLIASLWILRGFWKARRVAKQLKEGPQSHYQEIEGLFIHYQRIGSGPKMVLLHGIGASTFTWRRIFPLLAPKFELIIVDIPGFGRSSKRPSRDHGLDEQTRILDKFLTQIGVDRAILVGSSMGGAIALWMAKTYPNKYKDLAVLAPAVSPRLLPVDVARLSALPLQAGSLLLTKVFFKSILKRVLLKDELITEDVVLHYQRPYIEDGNSIKTFVKATAVLSDTRLPSELKSINARTLVLYGAKDKMVPKSVMDQLRKTLPHNTYLEHENAGHHPMEDQPEWVAASLIDFFL